MTTGRPDPALSQTSYATYLSRRSARSAARSHGSNLGGGSSVGGSSTRRNEPSRYAGEFGLGSHLAQLDRSSSVASSVAPNLGSRRWKGVTFDDTKHEREFTPSETGSIASESGRFSRLSGLSASPSFRDLRHQLSVNKNAEKVLSRVGSNASSSLRSQLQSGSGPYVHDKTPSTGQSVLSTYDAMREEEHRKLGPDDWTRKEILREARATDIAASLSARMAGLDFTEDDWAEQDDSE